MNQGGPKIAKSRAFKDRLKGHKDTIIALSSPQGSLGGLLLSASKDGQIRGTLTTLILVSLGFNRETDHDKAAAFKVAERNHCL